MTTVLLASKTRTRKKTGTRYSVRLEAKAADAWIGAFWSTTTGPDHRWAVLDLWVCLVPCLPIHVFFNRPPMDRRPR